DVERVTLAQVVLLANPERISGHRLVRVSCTSPRDHRSAAIARAHFARRRRERKQHHIDGFPADEDVSHTIPLVAERRPESPRPALEPYVDVRHCVAAHRYGDLRSTPHRPRMCDDLETERR